ncbi:hypothetical protein BD779DRAFT_1547236 [Infundibulicybe gibba]|nr:hypothetical protein BD779DRAFT_1547236 [Infundibulicybe gibba]
MLDAGSASIGRAPPSPASSCFTAYSIPGDSDHYQSQSRVSAQPSRTPGKHSRPELVEWRVLIRCMATSYRSPRFVKSRRVVVSPVAARMTAHYLTTTGCVRDAHGPSISAIATGATVHLCVQICVCTRSWAHHFDGSWCVRRETYGCSLRDSGYVHDAGPKKVCLYMLLGRSK